VIDEFITFGGLYNAIQRHHAAKSRVLEDNQILMIGLFMIQHVINGKVLPKVIVQRFMPQRIFGHW